MSAAINRYIYRGQTHTKAQIGAKPVFITLPLVSLSLRGLARTA